MLLGLLTTVFLIPNTTGPYDKPSTLKVLAAEDHSVNNLTKRMLNGKADEPLLRPNEERTSAKVQRSSNSHPDDMEEGAEHERYTDNLDEQDLERTSAMAENQPEEDKPKNVELDEINLGETALVGFPQE